MKPLTRMDFTAVYGSGQLPEKVKNLLGIFCFICSATSQIGQVL
jgi:hypothetical protein